MNLRNLIKEKIPGLNLSRKSPHSQVPSGGEGLERQLAGLKEDLVQAQARIQELEKLIANRDQLVMRKERELKLALGSYRANLAKENPDILPELLYGETVEALDNSLAKAQQLTEKVRARLEEKTREIYVPTGAPERAPMDIESLSSTEKIKEGLMRVRR